MFFFSFKYPISVCSYLRQVPRYTPNCLLCFSHETLQLTVVRSVPRVETGERVVFFVGEIALPFLWSKCSDVFCCHFRSRDFNEVFLTWLDLKAFLLHHGKVIWASEEHREGIELSVKCAKGHIVRVKVKNDPQSVVDSVWCLNCSLFKLWPLTSLSTSMEWICISELSLLFFQDRTIRLGQLKSLDLSYNSLTEMPDMVENIPHLQDLRMSHNRISRITGK